jgi:hypothetical protein
MADLQASFGISFADEVSPGAKSSAKSLEDLEGQIKTDTAAISGMTKALKIMQQGTVVDVAAFKQLRTQLADTKIRLASNQNSAVKLGQTFGHSAKDAKSLGDELKGALSGVGGPIGSIAGKLTGMAEKLGKAGVVGGAILANAALIALGAAAIYAFTQLAKFGLAAADARRSENIMLEGMMKVPMWFGIWGQTSRTTGAQIEANINAIVGSVSQSREEIVGLAGDLARMGISGKASLKAVADAQDVGGERGKQYALGLITWNRMLGKSSEQTAKIIEAQFGALAASKSMGFSVQMAKMHENIKGLFAGIKIEGFLAALQKVTKLFSLDTETGKALKQIIETLFNPIFGGAGKAGDLIKDLFRDAVISVQKVIIWFQELEIWALRTFGAKWIDEAQGTAFKAVLVGIIGLLTGISLLLGVIAVKVLIATAPFWAIQVAIVAAAAAVYLFADQLVKAFHEISLDDIGHFIIGGLWRGIKDEWTSFIGGFKGLISSIPELFRKMLGIHSPSLVFKAQARFIPMGVAAGINSGMPVVHQAMRRMYITPSNDVQSAFAPAPQAAPRQSEPQPMVNHFHIQSTEPKEVAEEVYRVLARLERRKGAA